MYNLKSVSFVQDSNYPHVLNILATNEYYHEKKIGSFNFFYKEGFLTLLNGKRKEFKQWQSLLNTFYKYDECFGWHITPVEAAKQAGNDMIKADKKAIKEAKKELQTNKAIDFLNKVLNKDAELITMLKDNHGEKSDVELLNIINNTFKNVISKQLAGDILNAIKDALQPEAETMEQTETTYTVGNKSFNTYSEAEAYCHSVDYEPSLMIKEAVTIQPLNDNKPIQEETYHLYKNTFKTYSEAFDYACKYQIPVTMIISSLHPYMTNERLQELERQYVFNKSNMSIEDIQEYFKYISDQPITLDREDRYYKLKSYIDRYNYRQQQREQRQLEQRRQAEAIDEMLKDLYSIGMTKKEYSSLVTYYLNGEKIYSWLSGISTEKMYNELLQVHELHYKKLVTV